MSGRIQTRLLVSSGLAAVLVAMPCLASAADQPAAAAAPGAVSEIAEVVVTAHHRTEKLQDVAISAQVVSSQAIVQSNTNSIESLTSTMPGVTVVDSGRNSNMYIRGIGSGENESFDQSVATFIDDVYNGRSRTTAATFLDLDRVEVLKGPQSTFFGNNAIAGALNIVTKKPSDVFDLSGRALYGSYGEYAVEGAVGGLVSDKVDVRGAFMVNGMNGWVTNINNNDTLPKTQDDAARVSVLVKPTADLDVTLKVEGSTHSENAGPYPQIFNCPPPAPFTAGPFCALNLANHISGALTSNTIDTLPGQGSKLYTADAVLTANYRIADHTITSVTSFGGYRFNINISGDDTTGIPGANLPFVTVQNPETYRQFSQELRIASPTGHTFEYMGGLYFQTDHLYTNEEFAYFLVGPVLGAPLGEQVSFTQNESTYSAFGSLAWNITDKLKLSGGLRASLDHKAYDWALAYGAQTSDYGGFAAYSPAINALLSTKLPLGTPGALSGARTDRAVMPSAQLQYKLTPRAMTYFSYSRGFKAGGFNGTELFSGAPVNAAQIPFNPEYVDAYELGVKSQWFNNRVLLNLDVFYSQYRDLQVASTVIGNNLAVVGLINNAGSSISKGVELEGQWVVTPDIHLSTNATYLNAYYVKYPNAALSDIQQLARITNPQLPPVQNLAGRPTNNAPMWSGTVTGSYRAHLPGDYELTTELTGFFTSSYYFSSGTDDAVLSQTGYGRLDGRMTLTIPNSRWSVDFIAKNLTDKAALGDAFYLATNPGSIGGHRIEPRSFSGQVRFKW